MNVLKDYVLCVIVFVVVVGLGIMLANSLFKYSEAKVEDGSTYVDLLDINMIAKENVNLMIVAHPDDETIWGGAHLLEENYFVVCVTCGNVDYRDAEFKEVMKRTGDSYTFLGYSDLEGSKISDWENEKERIAEDLELIIKGRDWEKIVTHNPVGEYGHKHHIMISEMVSKVASKDNLYYFGRYYKENEIPVMERVNSAYYKIKMNDLISVYKSQPRAMKRHKHMMEYENFVQYYDW